MKIRPFNINDLEKTAEVHQAAFIRQGMSKEWIESNSNAYPRIQYFVAEDHSKEIVGYIHWSQKSGFRPEVILELEQIAVHPEHQRKGIGKKLILESLPQIKEQLATRGATIKHVFITTRSDNYAQELYKKAIGAEVETKITNLYSADEVFMISRNIKI